MVLSQWVWDELGLWRFIANFESHGTFPRLASKVHLTPLFRPLLEEPISLYTLVSAHNKCNSKYTMRSATRVQVVELRPIKYGSFCATAEFVLLDKLSCLLTAWTWMLQSNLFSLKFMFLVES
jgi:hypothetical protein